MANVAGMLPLARELLKRGVTVIMAANERPSINDTTAAELSVAVQSAAREDKLLRRALDEQALSVMSSGSDMPVIDLSRVRTLDDPDLRACAACALELCTAFYTRGSVFEVVTCMSHSFLWNLRLPSARSCLVH